jgi:hypothetical protein
MKTDDYLMSIFVLVIVGVCIALALVFRQLLFDLVPPYDPVAGDLEQALALLWRLIDLVAERCGR